MSHKGHIPIRMCMGCRKRRKKAELLRFTRTVVEGTLRLNPDIRVGRGLYLCPDDACLKAVKKRWRLEPFLIYIFTLG
jgi:predicted RNA-binding protein YlxR (DUF448 family)